MSVEKAERITGSDEPLLTPGESKPEASKYDARAAKTHWREIYIVSVFYFFAYVTYQALTLPVYNYLKYLDKDVDPKYNGYVSSIFKITHALSIVYFALNTFVTRRYRTNLIIGRIIAIIGCVIYLLIELFPVPLRKFVVIVTFILHATAEGSIIIVRSYVPRISTPEDRPAAYSIKNFGVLASIIVGPLIQLIFALIPFPTEGIHLISPWLRINSFTGVIWLVLVMNIGTLYCAIAHISEPSDMEGEKQDKSVPLGSSLRKAWAHLQTVDKPLIGMCMVEKAISGGGFLGLFTILSPYIMATYNMNVGVKLLILSLASVVCGIFACATAMLFIFAKLGARISSSRLYPISLLVLLVLFTISFPFPFVSDKLVVYNNVTAPDGCPSRDYAWCSTALVTPKYFMLSTTVILIGVAMPFSLISQDTIYSRVLEGMDQNIMQAAYVIAEDVVLAATPTLAMLAFKDYSPNVFWIGSGIAMVIGLVLYIPVYSRLRKLGI